MAATREDRSSLAGGYTMLDVANPSSIKEAHSFTSPNSFLLFGVKPELCVGMLQLVCRVCTGPLKRGVS